MKMIRAVQQSQHSQQQQSSSPGNTNNSSWQFTIASQQKTAKDSSKSCNNTLTITIDSRNKWKTWRGRTSRRWLLGRTAVRSTINKSISAPKWTCLVLVYIPMSTFQPSLIWYVYWNNKQTQSGDIYYPLGSEGWCTFPAVSSVDQQANKQCLKHVGERTQVTGLKPATVCSSCTLGERNHFTNSNRLRC